MDVPPRVHGEVVDAVGLDFGFGPEGIEEEVALYRQAQDQEIEPKSRKAEFIGTSVEDQSKSDHSQDHLQGHQHEGVNGCRGEGVGRQVDKEAVHEDDQQLEAEGTPGKHLVHAFLKVRVAEFGVFCFCAHFVIILILLIALIAIVLLEVVL